MNLSNDERARVVQRVKGQTLLSDYRVREIADDVLRDTPGRSATTSLDPVERAVMRITQRLWAEERALGLRGGGGRATAPPGRGAQV